MTATLTLEASQIEAAGRAVLYTLCAYGLAQPTSSRWLQVNKVLLPAALTLDTSPPLSALIEEVSAATPTACEALASSHLRLFPPIVSQDAPGYETAYRGSDLFIQVGLLADIAGFYKAHGLRSGGPVKERPDHIVVELEFCALLAKKELYALVHLSSHEVEVCRNTRTTFLRDHLGCWAPAFGRRLAAVTQHPFYRSLGLLTAAWIEAEMATEGVTPAECADQPLPQESPDDGECGPCAVPSAGRT